jgi:hypothetical protein
MLLGRLMGAYVRKYGYGYIKHVANSEEGADWLGNKKNSIVGNLIMNELIN